MIAQGNTIKGCPFCGEIPKQKNNRVWCNTPVCGLYGMGMDVQRWETRAAIQLNQKEDKKS